MDEALVDVRGTRFSAWITTLVLAVVLLTSSTALVALQAVVFLTGAVFGLRVAPYGLLFRWLVRPRLGPPAELEPEGPPRFAQAVGAVFAVVATVGFALGWSAVGLTATALALAAAFLNAAFGFCLGCEMYLFALRWSGRTRRTNRQSARPSVATESVATESVATESAAPTTSAAATSNDGGVSV